MSGKFDWKKTFKIVFKILCIIIIILAIGVISLAGTFFYIRWKAEVQEKNSGDRTAWENLLVPEQKELEPKVTCLFLGVNGNLTDFIMFGQYDPNTREIDLVSIPRDSYVGKASIDGKINSTYSSNHNSIDKIKTEVERITGMTADHYVLFNTDILKKIVDEIGGVTVDVPINMNYDDPFQNLHIHLNKGLQTLNGSQAEQFVRFRQNNNGTGYPGGDVERTKAQQQFIKAFVNDLLKVGNITKVSKLINIVIEGTKTDITLDVAKEYIDDVLAIRTDRIQSDTLPGAPKDMMCPLGYVANYWVLDEAGVKEMIDQLFYNKEIESGEEKQSVTSQNIVILKGMDDTIRIELLNAGASSTKANELVNSLKEEGFYVAKIGNYETTKTETSRIIDYETCTETVINRLKETAKINKVEAVTGESSVDFTIIIGPNY